MNNYMHRFVKRPLPDIFEHPGDPGYPAMEKKLRMVFCKSYGEAYTSESCSTKIYWDDKVVLRHFVNSSRLAYARRLDNGGVMRIDFGAPRRRKHNALAASPRQG